MNPSLRSLLMRHEGCILRLYQDSVGKWTIGVGHNIQDNGITYVQAMDILADDAAMHEANIRAVFPEFDTFSENRQNALVDMMFNLGPGTFAEFHNMIAAIHASNWAGAAKEMTNSLWAQQVGARATEDANMVEAG